MSDNSLIGLRSALVYLVVFVVAGLLLVPMAPQIGWGLSGFGVFAIALVGAMVDVCCPSLAVRAARFFG